MSTKTTNLGYILPDATDPQEPDSRAAWNSNFTALDMDVKTLQDMVLPTGDGKVKRRSIEDVALGTATDGALTIVDGRLKVNTDLTGYSYSQATVTPGDTLMVYAEGIGYSYGYIIVDSSDAVLSHSTYPGGTYKPECCLVDVPETASRICTCEGGRLFRVTSTSTATIDMTDEEMRPVAFDAYLPLTMITADSTAAITLSDATYYGLTTGVVTVAKGDVLDVKASNWYGVSGAAVVWEDGTIWKSSTASIGQTVVNFEQSIIATQNGLLFVTNLRAYSGSQLAITRRTYGVASEASASEHATADVLYGARWYACGDSFTEGFWANSDPNTPNSGLVGKNDPYVYSTEYGMYKSYPYWIKERTGIDAVNLGVSGSTLGTVNDSHSITPFISTYQSLIGEDADYVTLWFGINDAAHCTLGTISDTSTATFYGAYNTVLQWLATSRPYAKVGVVVSPEGTAAFRQAVRDVAAKWGVPCLDWMGDSSIPPLYAREDALGMDAAAVTLNRTRYEVGGTSGSHPNVEGHRMIAGVVEGFLRGMHGSETKLDLTTYAALSAEAARATKAETTIASDLDVDHQALTSAGVYADRTVSGGIVTISDRADADYVLTVTGKSYQASTPTPTAPVSVDVVDGPIVVRKCGKNLINNWTHATGKTSSGGVDFTRNADGSVTLNGTAAGILYYNLDFHDAKDACTSAPIGISCIKSVPSATGVELVSGYYRADGTYAAATGNPIVYPSDATKMLNYIRVASGAVLSNVTVYPQIEVGTVATSYEQYHDETFSITLPTDHPYFASLPDGTADTLTVEDGIATLVERVGKVVLDGTQASVSLDSTGTYYRYWLIHGGSIGTSDSGNVYDDYFPASNGYNLDTIHCYVNKQYALLYNTLTTIAEWNAWIASHNVTIYYQLMTPVTLYSADGSTWATTKPASGIISMPQLASGVNNISVSDALAPTVTVAYKGYNPIEGVVYDADLATGTHLTVANGVAFASLAYTNTAAIASLAKSTVATIPTAYVPKAARSGTYISTSAISGQVLANIDGTLQIRPVNGQQAASTTAYGSCIWPVY